LADYICLKANYHYLVDERFQCEHKIRERAKRAGYTEAKRHIAIVNGCNKITEQFKYEIDNIKYHTCFCQFKHPQMHIFLNLFNQYEKSILPFSGGACDQPAVIMEVFSILSDMKLEREIEQAKEQAKKNG